MRRLYTLMLVIVPLLSLSQTPQTDIERKGNKWVISNDAANAYHFLTVERDSLLKEVSRLRDRIDTLESEKKEIIKLALNASQQIDEQVNEQQQASDQVDESQSNILRYFKKQSKGIQLTGYLLTDVQQWDAIRFQPRLSFPLTGNWFFASDAVITQDNKPSYLVGVGYRFL